jgi:hypothetical protein
VAELVVEPNFQILRRHRRSLLLRLEHPLIDECGYREILGICEGPKEDKEGWSAFLKHLKERGLKGVRLITSDAYRSGTLRGMHYQQRSETGALRQRGHLGRHHRHQARLAYLSQLAGVTLTVDVVVNYLISEPYEPRSAYGLRQDDPSFGITWPLYGRYGYRKVAALLGEDVDLLEKGLGCTLPE